MIDDSTSGGSLATSVALVAGFGLACILMARWAERTNRDLVKMLFGSNTRTPRIMSARAYRLVGYFFVATGFGLLAAAVVATVR